MRLSKMCSPNLVKETHCRWNGCHRNSHNGCRRNSHNRCCRRHKPWPRARAPERIRFQWTKRVSIPAWNSSRTTGPPCQCQTGVNPVRKLVAAGAGEWYITSTVLTRDITTWCLEAHKSTNFTERACSLLRCHVNPLFTTSNTDRQCRRKKVHEKTAWCSRGGSGLGGWRLLEPWCAFGR